MKLSCVPSTTAWMIGEWTLHPDQLWSWRKDLACDLCPLPLTRLTLCSQTRSGGMRLLISRYVNVAFLYPQTSNAAWIRETVEVKIAILETE